MKNMWVYILRCADNSFYVGVTNDVERRFQEHQTGLDCNCYTFRRRPLILERTEIFNGPNEAIRREKQLKKWTHAKKQALINEDWEGLKNLAKCKEKDGSTSSP